MSAIAVDGLTVRSETGRWKTRRETGHWVVLEGKGVPLDQGGEVVHAMCAGGDL